MDFGLTEDLKTLQKAVRDFMEKECPAEYVRLLDEEERFPYEFFEKIARMGWNALPYPAEYEGIGLGAEGLVILGEEISRFAYEIATGYGMSIFSGLHILRHGTEEQKQFFLPKMIKNELRFSVGITEPDAGSDAMALTTSAVLDGDNWVINGQKTFQTTADAKDTVICLYVRTDENLPKHKGVSMILVPNDTPGISIRRIETLGRKIMHANEVFLDDVRVPGGNLIGEINGGVKVLLSGLELERIFASSTYIGASQRVVDLALEWAKNRKEFGRPIGNFQAIGHMLADMQTEIDAVKLLTYRTAWMHDNSIPCMKEVCMAKLFGSEMYARHSNQGMQVMGEYGYIMTSEMQRHFRDSRVVTIAGGSSQMQRNTIAREMGVKVV